MKSSQKGFSLVQLIISLGIVGASSLVITQMMGTSGSSAKKTAVRQEIAEVTNKIQIALSDRATCTATLQNLKANPNSKTIMKGVADKVDRLAAPIAMGPMFTAVPADLLDNPPDNFILGQQGTVIKDITLNTASGSNYIEVQFYLGKRSPEAEKTHTRRFTISIAADGLQCESERDDSTKQIEEESCRVMGGTWVASASPKCQLDNLPKCIMVLDATQCNTGLYVNINDPIRVGIKTGNTFQTTAIQKCCRNAAPNPPVIDQPTAPACDASIDPDACASCEANPSQCPKCGPADGMPYYQPGAWGPCVGGTQSRGVTCVTSDPQTLPCTGCASPSTTQACTVPGGGTSTGGGASTGGGGTSTGGEISTGGVCTGLPDGTFCGSIAQCGQCCNAPTASNCADCSHGGSCGGICRPNLDLSNCSPPTTTGSCTPQDGTWSDWGNWGLLQYGGSELGRSRFCSAAVCGGTQICPTPGVGEWERRPCLASGSQCMNGAVDNGACSDCCSGSARGSIMIGGQSNPVCD